VLAVSVLLSGCAVGSATGTGGAPGPSAAATARRTPLASVRPVADPRAITGPDTAKAGEPDVIPAVTDPVPTLPATVTDAQGTRVRIRSDSRILALDLYGTLAATVFGLGLGPHVVGRDTSTGFPSAAGLPLVTVDGHQLNAEAILRLHPTVLITDTTLGPWDVVLQVRDAGVPVVVVDSTRTLGNATTLVHQVAAALGVRPAGTALANRLHRQITATTAAVHDLAPADRDRRLRMAFLYVRGQAGVYYLFGRGSGADSLIDALAGVDVASAAGVRGMTPLNAEALVAAKPDVLLVMTDGLKSVGGVSGLLKLPGVAQTPAGRHRRVVDMADTEILSFGPRTPDVLDALARALYAPARDTGGAG
jgi:iron complex transport system substrate-binding protein